MISEKAMILISNIISRGDFDSLKGLVQESSIETIKKNYSRLSPQQKDLIGTKKDDIQMQTLHLFETASPSDDVTFVKIGLLFQIVPGITEAFDEAKRNPNSHLELIKKFQNDLIVADYQ